MVDRPWEGQLEPVGKVAGELGISPGTVRNWIQKGYIHAIRLPSGVRRIPTSEVERLLNEFFAFPSPQEGESEPRNVRPTPSSEAVYGPVMADPTPPAGSSGRSRRASSPPDRTKNR